MKKLKIVKCPDAYPEDNSENNYNIKRLDGQKYIGIYTNCLNCKEKFVPWKLADICPKCLKDLTEEEIFEVYANWGSAKPKELGDEPKR